jgi:hypothetical protein
MYEPVNSVNSDILGKRWVSFLRQDACCFHRTHSTLNVRNVCIASGHCNSDNSDILLHWSGHLLSHIKHQTPVW